MCSYRLHVNTPCHLCSFPYPPSLPPSLFPRLMREISGSVDMSSDPKKLLSEISSFSNPHLPGLLNIATRAGLQTPLSTIEVHEDLEEETVDEGREKCEWDFALNVSEMRFTDSVRDVFFGYFVERFTNYENFVIMPSQSYEQWIRNREQFQNFDKTAFLSDQPSSCRPFYAAFLETSMFSAFIDQKISALYNPELAGPALTMFDSRVEAFRDKSGLAKPPTAPSSRSESK